MKSKIKSKIELSVRELEVVKLIVLGYGNRDIGKMLYIGIRTVKTHIINIFNKLGVHNRTQLTTYVFKLKILDLEHFTTREILSLPENIKKLKS
jgi:DNA-binding NarL/FixJ family response regulator